MSGAATLFGMRFSRAFIHVIGCLLRFPEEYDVSYQWHTGLVRRIYHRVKHYWGPGTFGTAKIGRFKTPGYVAGAGTTAT
eukprot:199316-Chlamydomonas_euryale.AAC.2